MNLKILSKLYPQKKTERSKESSDAVSSTASQMFGEVICLSMRFRIKCGMTVGGDNKRGNITFIPKEKAGVSNICSSPLGSEYFCSPHLGGARGGAVDKKNKLAPAGTLPHLTSPSRGGIIFIQSLKDL